MSECYQATFRWPHRDASNVIVTGSFDGWSCSRYLTKSNSGFFEGTVQIPWGEKVAYKYIVDGRWTTTDDRPTEMDNEGNLNNVYRAPARSESPFKPAPATVQQSVTETKAPTENGGVGSSVGAAGAVGAVTAAVAGVVETAKQAAVDMVEAMAPGTTDPAAVTPVVETPKPEPTPAAEPAQALEATSAPALPVHAPEPTPAPVPEPSQLEVAATETTTAILPSQPVPVAPDVPVTILPLGTEPPSEAINAPLATAVVEGTSTVDTSSPPAPAPAAEDKPSAHVPAPVSDTVDEKPTADVVGPSEEKSATNGTSPSGDKAAINGTSAVNGTDGSKPTTTDGPTPATTDSPSKAGPTAVNGAEEAAPANGKTAMATTPTKEKKMRFPSLSSRSSKHSRARSSAEATSPSTGHDASELGERTGQAGNGNGKDTVSSRFASSQRQKRTSIFGKLKDVFAHHKNEPPSS